MTGLIDLRIMLVVPGGERPFGTFTVTGNEFSGHGSCGTRYAGSFTASSSGGFDVVMTSTIPQGTRIGSNAPATEDRTFCMKLHLTPSEAAGIASKQVLLPGFGRARLRFVTTQAG